MTDTAPAAPIPATAPRSLLVLGGGPAGYPAAFRAAELGLDVTLVERRPALGGTCLHCGCIPSKALLHAADIAETLRGTRSADLGIRPASDAPPAIDLPALRAWKDSVIDKLAAGTALLAKKLKIRRITGNGTLVPADTPDAPPAVSVDGTLYRADALLVATGSVASMPRGWPAPSRRIWTSDEALALPEIPEKLAVIGGGNIGLELGLAYAGLGASVTVLEALPALLPMADRDLLVPLLRTFRKTFAALRTGVQILDLREDPDGVSIDLRAPDGATSTERYSHVLVATGRRPAAAAAGAAEAGLLLDARGFLPAGPTNRPATYAAGDSATGPMLAHKATREAVEIVEALAQNRPPRPVDAAAVPSVLYTRPAIGWVGLTETAAKAASRPVRVAKSAFGANGRAIATGAPDGHVKLVIDPETDVLLGGAAVGEGADWVVGELANAIALKLRASDLAAGIRPHPSLSESIFRAASGTFA